MKIFRNYPFVRLLSFQLSGIYLAGFIPGAGKLLPAILLILIVWMFIPGMRKKYPFDLVHSAALVVLIVSLSFVNARNQRYTLPGTDDGPQRFVAVVLNNPLEKAHSFQTVVRILQTDSFPAGHQKVLVYLEKEKKALSLRPGDIIFARSETDRIQNSGNPFEFNYRDYMDRKQIRHSTFITSQNYVICRDDKPSILPAIKRLQKNLVSELKKKMRSGEAFQVVSALALGYRDELTKEIQSYFISTGTMHILSVSGLHVAMIFLFLDLLFAFLKSTRLGRFLYLFMMIFSLWGYALLTGFSPPVQRAAVMFSFILIGNSLNRAASIYNSIAASAFFLLLFNPDLLFDIGFQLSYLALISIVFFYPKLNQFLKLKNWLLNRIWQLCCVSLAAQIGVVPLSVYYFHQFPVYFCLSNFVVIPAGYLILGLTAAFFSLYPFENLTSFVAGLLSQVTDITLWLLKRTANLPFAVIDGLSVSFVQYMCLFLLFGTIMLFIVYRRHAFFFAGLVLLLLCQLDGLIQKITLFGQQKLIVYRSDEALIHLINGRANYLISSSEDPPDPFLYNNVVFNLKLKEPLVIHRRSSGQKEYRDLIIRDPIIQFAGKSLILTKRAPVKFSDGNSMIFTHGLLNLDEIAPNKIYLEPQ